MEEELWPARMTGAPRRRQKVCAPYPNTMTGLGPEQRWQSRAATARHGRSLWVSRDGKRKQLLWGWQSGRRVPWSASVAFRRAARVSWHATPTSMLGHQICSSVWRPAAYHAAHTRSGLCCGEELRPSVRGAPPSSGWGRA
ncbi:hypothetical protein KVR01_001799 [Diaporthe batatas]|uniref:uncharacterized protein n=1 Tax=Diaporthe batatas TaxID=748121 RepID=UPI001D042A9D|nr:uncharacterized protein KVR01_001799 [Diaporthe batatas]KAG8169050.1 hypothetical protein KVR01_001799 [Diaporthe batatas]